VNPETLTSILSQSLPELSISTSFGENIEISIPWTNLKEESVTIKADYVEFGASQVH